VAGNIFHKRLVQARQLVSELKKKTGAIQEIVTNWSRPARFRCKTGGPQDLVASRARYSIHEMQVF
jgi:hypothetical protein